MESVHGLIDAVIVETEYFDISGRKLNEMPQQGLFMKVETDAKGVKKVTKIMK